MFVYHTSKKLSSPYWNINFFHSYSALNRNSILNLICTEVQSWEFRWKLGLCRIYKANPSWDNWIAYKRGNAQCQKILRKEKRTDWCNLCSSFTNKTSTSKIWRFIKAYKVKSLTSELPGIDQKSFTSVQNTALNKLCPPSYLHYPYPSLDKLKLKDTSSLSLYTWIDDSLSLSRKLPLNLAKRILSLGLINLTIRLLRFFPHPFD